MTVNAQVHHLAGGHLPPWQRAHPRIDVLTYQTGRYREKYETWENIFAQEVLAANVERSVLVADGQGGFKKVPVKGFVTEAVRKLAEEV